MLVLTMKQGQYLQIGPVRVHARYRNGAIKFYLDWADDTVKVTRESNEDFIQRLEQSRKEPEWKPES